MYTATKLSINTLLLLPLPNVTMTCNSGIAPITNEMAAVMVNGLECGVTYTIIAGGTLNRGLVGPRSSHGNITTVISPEDAGGVISQGKIPFLVKLEAINYRYICM